MVLLHYDVSENKIFLKMDIRIFRLIPIYEDFDHLT